MPLAYSGLTLDSFFSVNASLTVSGAPFISGDSLDSFFTNRVVSGDIPVGFSGIKPADTYMFSSNDTGIITFRSMNMSLDNYSVLGGQVNTEGYLNPPSLGMSGYGSLRFKWIVTSGLNSISVSVKQQVNVNPRPALTIKQNVSLGMTGDISGVAALSTDWVDIGPLNLTTSTNGAVYVELSNRVKYQFGSATCYWDNIVTSHG